MITNLSPIAIVSGLGFGGTCNHRMYVRMMATKKLVKTEQFGSVNDENLGTLTEKFVPKNTDKCTKWAMKNFTDWREAHNLRSDDKCPETLLEDSDPSLLNKWLAQYVAETRREDVTPYPPKSIQGLLSGLLRIARQKNAGTEMPNSLQKSNPRFAEFHNTLHNVYRKLNEDGIGITSKPTLYGRQGY